LKILFVQHVREFGGSGRSLFELASALKKMGARMGLVSPQGKCSEKFISLGIPVYNVVGVPQFDNTQYGYYRGTRWAILLREIAYIITFLYDTLKERKCWKNYDIIHLNDYTLLPAAIILRFFIKRPLIVHCRSVQRKAVSSLRARLVNKIYQYTANKIVAIDETVASSLSVMPSYSIIHNSYSVLNSGAKLELLLPQFVMREFEITLGFAGSISFMKGIFELVEALGILKLMGIRAQLIIAGGHEKHSLKKGISAKAIKAIKGDPDIILNLNNIIQKYSLEESISFLGYKDDLSKFYNGIDVLCFTTKLNAAGRPVFEAAFYGVPSIVSVDRSWPDTIIDKETGLIVSNNDPSSIADAIEYFVRNPGEIKRLGDNAKKLAETFFSPLHNTQLMFSIYAEVLRHEQ
jgi:glycosyltransferase involved in cell wall biosynthesis